MRIRLSHYGRHGVVLRSVLLICFLLLIPALAAAGQVLVTAEAGPFGVIIPAGTVPLAEGEDVLFSLRADVGCHIEALYVDCRSVDIGGNPRSFDYPVEDFSRGHSLRAVFARDWLTIPEARFTDSGQDLGAFSSRGIGIGDLDGDGDLDAFVTYEDSPNRVWFNDGTGQFLAGDQEIGGSAANSRGVALGDLDGDGDLDAFVTNKEMKNQVLLNDGKGRFVESCHDFPEDESVAVALGDMDGDGDLDAFVANYGEANGIWLNDGTGHFEESGQTLGKDCSMGIALGDLDGDGDLDAFVVNRDEIDGVYFNDGFGIFKAAAQDLLSTRSMGVALGDVDGDGDLDVFVVNDFHQPNRVWLNDGAGRFADNNAPMGNANSMGVSLGDADGDGDLDAFVANYGEANGVWLNDGGGEFSDSGFALESLPSSGIALGDLDGDGDLDVFEVNKSSGGISQPDRVWFNRTGQYSLKFAVSGDLGGTLSGDVSQDLWLGSSSLPVEAVPVAGKSFGLWGDGSGNVWTGNPLVIDGVSSDMTVEAVFDTAVFEVSTRAGAGGTVSPEGDFMVVWSDDFPVVISPDEGYRIADVLVDGRSRGVLTGCTFADVSADHSLEARFVRKTCTVSTSSGPGGTVTPCGETVVSWGNDFEVTMTPHGGYILSSVTVDGSGCESISPFVFSGVCRDSTLRAEFVPDPRVLDDGGVEDILFPDDNEILDGFGGSGVSLDLPGGLGLRDCRFVASSDRGGLSIERVRSADIAGTGNVEEMAGAFVSGVSFDIAVSTDMGTGSLDVLPVDLEMILSEDFFSSECLEAIREDEPEAGLCGAFFSHVSMLKVVSGEVYDLGKAVLEAGCDPEDFFALSENERGNVLVGLRLLVVDADAGEEVPVVQVLPTDGSGCFLVFDGRRDGHFRDPLLAVEKEDSPVREEDTGCSLLGFLPVTGLMVLPLLCLLLIGR